MNPNFNPLAIEPKKKKTPKNHVSQGYKKDLLIVRLCETMLNMSMFYKGDDVLHLEQSNRSHQTKKRIHRRIDELSKKLNEIFDEQPFECYEYVAKKVKVLLPRVLNTIGDKTSLHMFPQYLLFVNFCEKSHKDWEELNTPELYMQNILLIKEAGIAEDDEERMMRFSYEVRGMIKN